MTEQTKGIFSVILAYTLWGMLPVYWKSVQALAPDRTIAHRILWSFVFLLIYAMVGRRLYQIRNAFKNRRQIVILALAAFIITLNWLAFIYAVNSGQVIAGSLGYYINPLVSIALGVVFYKERFSRIQLIAIGLAFAGVIVITVAAGKLPWLSLVIAFSFAFYGLLKKQVQVEAATGLMLETGFMVLPAILYLMLAPGSGLIPAVSPLAAGVPQQGTLAFNVLVPLAGIVTAIPLMLFSFGAKKLDLSVIGFMQYIAPTLMLLLGVFAYGETFTTAHIICFALIWSGLILYTYSRFDKKRALAASHPIGNARIKSRKK